MVFNSPSQPKLTDMYKKPRQKRLPPSGLLWRVSGDTSATTREMTPVVIPKCHLCSRSNVAGHFQSVVSGLIGKSGVKSQTNSHDNQNQNVSY